MQKNSQNFSMEDAMRLANSEAGQQLLTLLQQTNGDKLRSAMDQAAAGDYAGIQKTLSGLLASEEAKKLMKQMEG